jgi:hypothetical protein
VSWIRFLLRFDLKDKAILHRLYSDADWLSRFPEYHLQGNHLFENSIALLCAGLYFSNKRFSEKGTDLLRQCIEEQILQDGGHIEGSPMYHSLLLWRLMQCLELYEAVRSSEDAFSTFLRQTTGKMLGWLTTLTFSDGTWPMFNDAAADIAPTTGELLRYAAGIGLSPEAITLRESGYRMIREGAFELAVDVGRIQPAYQPGHSHADIGTFCLHYEGKAVLIDSGTSTYEVSPRRALERSTSAHNTVVIGGTNSSEMWKSFRVGRRARLAEVKEHDHSISLAYEPYAFPGVVHKRTLSWNDNCIQVEDFIQGYKAASEAFLHFDPSVEVTLTTDQLIQTEQLNIYTNKKEMVHLCDFQAASGFNQLKHAVCARFRINDYLIIKIGKR